MTDVRPVEPIVINTQPRPRVLVHGFEDEVAAQLREFIPTVKVVQSQLQEVRQAEWDAVITRGSLNLAAGHLFAVVQPPEEARGSQWSVEGMARLSAASPGLLVRYSPPRVSSELHRQRDLPERVEHLVRQVLEPLVLARPKHIHELFDVVEFKVDAAWKPFLTTGDGDALAARYTRMSGSEAWVLPSDVPDIVPWVRAAIGEWSKQAPERFPGHPDWSHEPQWQSPAERRHAASIDLARSEHRHVEDAFTQRAARLQSELAAAKEAADRYERLLLTGTGDELVAAVCKALRELGFEAVDADETARPSGLLQDLDVTDPAQPGWTAIAEVKGYTKGASTSALTQLIRFRLRYVQEHGGPPAAQWYIVNQFRGQDPATRGSVLHGKDEDIQVFAEEDGLIIDTVVLLRLLSQVRSGALTSEAARTLLRTSTGVLKLNH